MPRSITRSISRRDTPDPCPLAQLPPELLTVIFDHSTSIDLARWALTNGEWARAITPTLAAFWQKYSAMCDALKHATSFEQLEAVPKMSASCTLAPYSYSSCQLSLDVNGIDKINNFKQTFMPYNDIPDFLLRQG